MLGDASGLWFGAKSRLWQVCKAEISELGIEIIDVAVVYAKEQLLKRGLELFVLYFFKMPFSESV